MDYQKLNAVTHKDAYPLACIEESYRAEKAPGTHPWIWQAATGSRRTTQRTRRRLPSPPTLDSSRPWMSGRPFQVQISACGKREVIFRWSKGCFALACGLGVKSNGELWFPQKKATIYEGISTKPWDISMANRWWGL